MCCIALNVIVRSNQCLSRKLKMIHVLPIIIYFYTVGFLFESSFWCSTGGKSDYKWTEPKLNLLFHVHFWKYENVPLIFIKVFGDFWEVEGGGFFFKFDTHMHYFFSLVRFCSWSNGTLAFKMMMMA